MINIAYAAVGPFAYDGLQVERAGTLLVSHSNGKPCILLEHDRNVNKYMPASGSVDALKDADFYDALRRETLEETGGGIDHNAADLRKGKLPLIFSRRHKILLGVMNDNSLATSRLNASVTAAISDPSKPADWKEVDHFCAFPLENLLPIAESMHNFYKSGGQRTHLIGKFPAFTRFKGLRPGGGIVVVVKDENNIDRELDSYYMSAIAEAYDKLLPIIKRLPKPVPMPVISQASVPNTLKITQIANSNTSVSTQVLSSRAKKLKTAKPVIAKKNTSSNKSVAPNKNIAYPTSPTKITKPKTVQPVITKKTASRKKAVTTTKGKVLSKKSNKNRSKAHRKKLIKKKKITAKKLPKFAQAKKVRRVIDLFEKYR